MQVDAGLIGGTGTGEALRAMGGTAVHVPTGLGLVRGVLLQVGSKSVFATSRHSAGHKVPPHRVSYAATALAMKQLSARICLSTAAVGSLREDWGCGTLAVCRDFLDLSGRYPTLFDREVVHTDFSVPFPAADAIARACATRSIAFRDGAIYVCGNGPRYETPEEIRAFAKLGGDVVGMTAASEAIVMREAGIDYGCLAIVTNLACGLGEKPLSHVEVVGEMRRSGSAALEILLEAIRSA